MRWGFLGVVMATSLLCTSAQAAVVEEFKAEDWDGMAFTSDETGQFTHCSVFAVYRNGSTLFISYEAAESWYLSISNDEWALTEGGEYALKVKVDRRGEIDGTGIALATNQIGLPIEADHPFVGQLRRGNQLVFTFQNEDYAFELSNSSKAMNSAQECVRRHVAANTRSPVMSRQAEPEPAQTPEPAPAPAPAPEEQAATPDADSPATATGDQQEFGPWVVAATDDGAGNFVNCTAFGVHGDDQLILSYFPDGVWTFGLYRAAWNLDTNQTYYLWYNVDAPADAANVTKRPVEAAEPTRIYFEISDLEDIVARMEGGTLLNLQFRGLTGDAESYSYPLDQTPAAFEATRKCVADRAPSASVSKEGTGTKGATGVETETAEEAPTDEGADTSEAPTDQADTAEPRRELPQLGLTLIEEFDVPGWKAAAFSLDDGTFTHCAIKAEYQNGATLGVARAASGDLVLAIQHQDWAIESGAWVPISYSWKGAADLSISTEGQAVETNVIMVGLGSGDELTDSLRNAREMTIEAEEKALSFDVSDIGPGIDAIEECAERHASDDAEPSAAPPPAAKKAETVPEPETATPDVTASVDAMTADPGAIRTEAAGYTTALLFRAGYPNHVILGQDADVTDDVPAGDAVWQLGEIMGSTRIVDGGTPDEIKSDVGDGLLSQCGGVVTTDVLTSDASHAHFTLTCGASSPKLIHYLVLPRDAGGSYVFALLGAGDDVAAGTIADLVYGKAVGG